MAGKNGGGGKFVIAIKFPVSRAGYMLSKERREMGISETVESEVWTRGGRDGDWGERTSPGSGKVDDRHFSFGCIFSVGHAGWERIGAGEGGVRKISLFCDEVRRLFDEMRAERKQDSDQRQEPSNQPRFRVRTFILIIFSSTLCASGDIIG